MNTLTLIVPYYRNPLMLARQAKEWAKYPDGIRVVLVDDGSPEPAVEVLPKDCRAEVYRIEIDIPWNRNGARNLGASVAETEWILQVDIDHLLPIESIDRLLVLDISDELWFRFARFRVGKADDTRRKDELADGVEFGPVKPHIDSYLCTRELYWRVGGYDEDYSGSLGGSAPFLKRMAEAARCNILEDIPLHVYTRDAIADASDLTLSRDRTRFKKLRAEKAAAGDPIPINRLRFPWARVR